VYKGDFDPYKVFFRKKLARAPDTLKLTANINAYLTTR